MKWYVGIFLFLFIFSINTVNAQNPDVRETKIKLGVANLRRVMESFWKYELAQKRMAELEEKARKKAEEMSELDKIALQDLKILQESIQNPLFNEEVREKKRQELQEKQKEFMMRRNEHIEVANRLKSELLQAKQAEQEKLLTEIKSRLEVFAKNNGFNLILDSTDTPFAPSFVLYADSSFDITERVIQFINQDKLQETK